jgi:CubicO group peptidase (beta-lactamase class C family)
MRRVLTILTAIVLSLASLAVGLLTADLPFWRRALQLPLAQDEIYLPVATLGGDAASEPWHPATDAPASEALELAARRARDAGSRALLVMRGDDLVLSRYFGVDDGTTLMPAGVIARPVAAMAAGLALAGGHIESADVPVSRYLAEWDDEPRGRITLRQLLEETSGLEEGGDTARLLRRSPWAEPGGLPRFATDKGVRMLLGNDFVRSALRFRLRHEPGGFHGASPANAQLAAVIVERATGAPYEKFLDERLWRPAGAGHAELSLDRRAGMPAAHCCWRATAPDMLRVLGLLASDGLHRGRRVLPEGWAQEMARPSRVNADSGLQVSRADAGGWSALSGMAEGHAFWVIPELRLTILNIVTVEGETPPELAALLMRVYGPGR